MDYRERHVVVTGGTGALGQAVVSALIEGGAFCHVPFIHAPEAQRFALREHARVRLLAGAELSDEAAVERLYAGVPSLWASQPAPHSNGAWAPAWPPIPRARPRLLR